MVAIILWILGLVFILLEFYTPGAIMASIGAVLIITSIGLFITESVSILWVSLYLLGVIASIAAVIKFAIWRIPRTPAGYSIYLRGDQAGYQASSYNASCLHQTGVAATDLRPSGYIRIGSNQYPAISESGYVEKGQEVVVVGGEGDSLLITKKEVKHVE